MFQKISNLLSERAAGRRLLRDAETTKELRMVWEEHGVRLFPQTIQEHLKQHVRVARVLSEDIYLEVSDTHVKNAIALQQTAIKDLFEQHLKRKVGTIRLTHLSS